MTAENESCHEGTLISSGKQVWETGEKGGFGDLNYLRAVDSSPWRLKRSAGWAR